MFVDLDLIHGFNRALGLTNRGAECGEIVMPDQICCAFPHGASIQVMHDLPDMPLFMGHRRAPRYQAKAVTSLDGREAGMKIVSHAACGKDRDRSGFQMKVQRLGKPERVPFSGQIGMRDLTCGMDTRIGPACCRNPSAICKAAIKP